MNCEKHPHDHEYHGHEHHAHCYHNSNKKQTRWKRLSEFFINILYWISIVVIFIGMVLTIMKACEKAEAAAYSPPPAIEQASSFIFL